MGKEAGYTRVGNLSARMSNFHYHWQLLGPITCCLGSSLDVQSAGRVVKSVSVEGAGTLAGHSEFNCSSWAVVRGLRAGRSLLFSLQMPSTGTKYEYAGGCGVAAPGAGTTYGDLYDSYRYGNLQAIRTSREAQGRRGTMPKANAHTKRTKNATLGLACLSSGKRNKDEVASVAAEVRASGLDR